MDFGSAYAPGCAPPSVEVHGADGKTVAGTLVAMDAQRLVASDGRPAASRWDGRQAAAVAVKQPSRPAGRRRRACWSSWSTARRWSAELLRRARQGRCRSAWPTASVSRSPRRTSAGPLPASHRGDRRRVGTGRRRQQSGDVLVVAQGRRDRLPPGHARRRDRRRGPVRARRRAVAVKRAKVYGLVYYHAAGASSCRAVGRDPDASGSRWAASRALSRHSCTGPRPAG